MGRRFVAGDRQPIHLGRPRAKMLRMALDAKADVVVFIDHDIAWRPADLLKLIETDGDVN